jgi:hypothetical protein
MNDIEIIACKFELFKDPIINFINQEISAERERSIIWDFCNDVCAIKRQNYDPCQYGTSSLNISPHCILVNFRRWVLPWRGWPR